MAAKNTTSASARTPARPAKQSASKVHRSAPKKPASGTPPSAPAPSSEDVKGLRVRMFRVGFGDFFLLTVPTGKGAKHILIDCGVHAKDLKSIRDAVGQMAEDCDSTLALVIMTHRHADHISGFATCSDVFSQFTVERVWMPWFENPANKAAVAFQASLTALASRLSMRLAARSDPYSQELANMADNITGGMNAAGGGTANQKSLDVLQKGFKNVPEHDYYQAGDVPTLPKARKFLAHRSTLRLSHR
jgi:hypothetical protein